MLIKRTLTACTAVLVTGCGGAGGHDHGPPLSRGPNELSVEVRLGDAHTDALRRGISRGLSSMAFVVPTTERGEVEVEAEVVDVGDSASETVCKIKVMALRLPRHSLIGVLESSARVHGTGTGTRRRCIEELTASLVRRKLRGALESELSLKR